MATMIAGCDNNQPTTPGPNPPATVQSVAVSGTAPVVGATAQFAAVATMTGGTTQTVTGQATWSSSNTAIATVNASGMVTGVAPGEVDVTATYQTVAGALHVRIANAESRTFSITGTVTDGTTGGVLPNVDVQAAESGGKTTTVRTNGAGAYALNGVAAGPVVLSAAPVSYEPKTVNITLSANSVVDIVLTRTTCTLSVNTTSFSFPASGGANVVSVSSSATGCAWTAKSNDAFITITGGATGVDAGTVTFSVAANTDVSRVGTMTIAGKTVTVTQAAAGPEPIVQASFDGSFRTPACQTIGSGCSSGGLLAGSGSTEANQPNTLANGCSDGGGTHAALVEAIQIRTFDGSQLAAGKLLAVEAVLRLSVPSGRVRLFTAFDARNPVWTASSDMPVDATLSGNLITLAGFNWPAGGGELQAVRVAFSADGPFNSSCAPGPNDDTDDLVFRIR
jgi:lipopolysaccharide export system protein LptA